MGSRQAVTAPRSVAVLQEQPRSLLAAPWLAWLPAGAAYKEGTPRGQIHLRGLQQTKAAGLAGARRGEEEDGEDGAPAADRGVCHRRGRR